MLYRKICVALFLTFCLLTRTVNADEYLIKTDNKYLGRQVSATEFKVCSGEVLLIGKGQIIQAREKCGGKLPPAISFTEATIEFIKPDQRIIGVKVSQEKLNDLKKNAAFKPMSIENNVAEIYLPSNAKIIGKDGRDNDKGSRKVIKQGDIVNIGNLFGGVAHEVSVTNNKINPSIKTKTE